MFLLLTLNEKMLTGLPSHSTASSKTIQNFSAFFFLIRDDIVGNMFSLTHLMLPFTGFSCMDPPNICYGAFVLLFKVFVSFKRCLGMLNLFKAVIIV